MSSSGSSPAAGTAAEAAGAQTTPPPSNGSVTASSPAGVVDSDEEYLQSSVVESRISRITMRRLRKELMSLVRDPPEGLKIPDSKSFGDDLSIWTIDIDMDTVPNTLYAGETFSLCFKFGPKYPFDSPEVVFQGDNIPVHPHVYSNGHICLSILTEDWSPALSVSAVCLSVLSMLASAKEKKRPPDDQFYIRTCPKNPKKTRWWYHDNNV